VCVGGLRCTRALAPRSVLGAGESPWANAGKIALVEITAHCWRACDPAAVWPCWICTLPCITWNLCTALNSEPPRASSPTLPDAAVCMLRCAVQRQAAAAMGSRRKVRRRSEGLPPRVGSGHGLQLEGAAMPSGLCLISSKPFLGGGDGSTGAAGAAGLQAPLVMEGEVPRPHCRG
jgi:hypothetical protein